MTPRKFCVECGARLNPEAAFCGQCGARVQTNAETPSETDSAVPKRKSNTLIIVVLVFVAAFILGSATLGVAGWFLVQNRKTQNQTLVLSGGDAPTLVPAEKSSDVATISDVLRFEDFESSDIDINGDGLLSSDPVNPANKVWRLEGDADLGFFLPLPSTDGGSDIQVTYDIFIPSQTVIMPIEGQDSPAVLVRTRLMDSDGNSALAGDTLPPSGKWQTVSKTFEDPAAGSLEIGIEALWFEGPIYIDNVTAKSISS